MERTRREESGIGAAEAACRQRRCREAVLGVAEPAAVSPVQGRLEREGQRQLCRAIGFLLGGRNRGAPPRKRGW